MGMQRLTVLLAVAGLLALTAAPGLAQQRVALVIGNATYAHAPRLANPLNDAADISAALARLGFAVTKLENANQGELRQGLLAFTRAASAAEVAVVFYAGHGIEVDQRNFLVPVDAKLSSDQDVEFETVPLELVMRSVARASGLRLVILDACRDNPFAVSMQRAGATRSVGRGLARVEPAGETLVAYAAKGGTVASDGDSRNSPYSAALLAHLEEPGLEVGLMFRKVRDAVLASTGGRQEPFVYGSLSSRGVYLTARLEPDPSVETGGRNESTSERLSAEQLAAQRLVAERELLFWESVKDSTNPADLQAYLDRYPGGAYGVLARNRLKALQGVAAPAAAEETAKLVEAALDLGIRERRLIQLGLAAEGFDPGDADGLFGGKTRGAIGRWQSSQGEEATEHLDVESAKLLMASGRKRQAQEQAGARQAAAEAERLKGEQEARQRAQREVQEKARREAQERARREAEAHRLAEERRRQQEWERLVMVQVEGGSFMMGCQGGQDSHCYDSARPVHRVQVRSFEIGKYEVTQAQWERVMGENPSRFGGCSNCPVEGVSWDDVQRFLSALNARTAGGFRLPTEAEWEYAARGGRQSRGYRYAGGNGLGSVGWYQDNSGSRTHPVGGKRANELGLHDMSGNVWESVQDCWNDSYRGAPGNGRAWESGDCSLRVARGGSWLFRPRFLRSANRDWNSTGFRSYDLGFRIARTLAP